MTPEHRAARLGKVGASRVGDVVARTKSGWGASRQNYRDELVTERLTGVPTEGYTNAAMQWGIDKEPEARASYGLYENVDVEEVGFILHPGISDAGASPDGLVGDEGLVEIKCPGTTAHTDVLLDEPIPQKYQLQMQWQMACTGRLWCDFVSYDPRLPENYRYFKFRVKRDDIQIAALEKEVRQFLHEVDERVQALIRKRGPPVGIAA